MRLDDVAQADARDAAAWIERARDGDFEAAWAISDRIRRRSSPAWTVPRHEQRIWDGTPLRGRVLIRCYHGLGDTLQFIRYASRVRITADHVTLWAQPCLCPLLETVDGIDRLLPLHDGDVGIAFDVDVEVMELPYVFRTTLASIPADVPYITATPASLPSSEPAPRTLRAGIVWRAGGWDPRRHVPFAVLQRLFDCDWVAWYSLQFDAPEDERDERLVPCEIREPLDTAALIAALDIVISIDSMPAHLAGALGARVWTLLPHAADWRWLRGRSDSPWYPTMRLFRQPAPGDWTSVIRDVSAALEVHSHMRSPPAHR